MRRGKTRTLGCMLRRLRQLSWLYLGAVAIAIVTDVVIALSTQYGVRTGTGCNFYDAMVFGVECRGFVGAKAVEVLLNWPLYLIYAPMFAFAAVWLLPVAVLLWLPPIFLAVVSMRQRHAT